MGGDQGLDRSPHTPALGIGISGEEVEGSYQVKHPVQPSPSDRMPETKRILREKIEEGLIDAAGLGRQNGWRVSSIADFERAMDRRVDGLLDEVLKVVGLGEPHLGAATNDEMHAELRSRISMGHIEGDYRTVDDG